MLVFEHLDVEDGDPTAGRSGKLTTGNIRWNIMFHLIFRAATDRPVAEPLTRSSTGSLNNTAASATVHSVLPLFIVSGWGEGIRVAFPDRTGSERHRTIRRP